MKFIEKKIRNIKSDFNGSGMENNGFIYIQPSVVLFVTYNSQ